MAPRLR